MSIRALKRMAILLMVWVAMQSCRLRADETITGNLKVTGNTLTAGTQTGTTNPGWGMLYTDGTNSTLEFQGTRSGNTWQWEQSNGSILQMTLDNTNTVTLYNSSGTPEITLSPTGPSSFNGAMTIGGSATIDGTDNEMPNQVLVGANSVLTEGLADSRYLSSGLTSLMIGSGSSATGMNSVAFGNNATASGAYSIAGGYYSVASGFDSVALGSSSAYAMDAIALGASTASGFVSTSTGYLTTASGAYSTAMGYASSAVNLATVAAGSYATASGLLSVAMGDHANSSGSHSEALGCYVTSSGAYSTAIGVCNVASGIASTASGYYTTAQAYGSFVAGVNNVGGGSTNTWVPTDPLFEIGNGGNTYGVGNPSTSTTSDALVVYKNGNAVVLGSFNAGGPITTAGAITSSGTITAPCIVTTTQNGDIPMYTGH